MSAAGRATGALVAEAPGAGYAVRLVLGVAPDDAALLLTAHLERASHRLVPEEPLADLLFDALGAERVLLLLLHVQMRLAPMRHEVGLLLEVLSAKITGTGLAEEGRAGPFVAGAEDALARDVLLPSPALTPQGLPRQFRLPSKDVLRRQLPPQQAMRAISAIAVPGSAKHPQAFGKLGVVGFRARRRLRHIDAPVFAVERQRQHQHGVLLPLRPRRSRQ